MGFLRWLWGLIHDSSHSVSAVDMFGLGYVSFQVVNATYQLCLKEKKKKKKEEAGRDPFPPPFVPFPSRQGGGRLGWLQPCSPMWAGVEIYSHRRGGWRSPHPHRGSLGAWLLCAPMWCGSLNPAHPFVSIEPFLFVGVEGLVGGCEVNFLLFFPCFSLSLFFNVNF